MKNTRRINLTTKKSDERDQIRKINKKKIIEDEETVQLHNLSTAIEKINRKGSNNEESDKSDTEERDKKKIIEDEETVQLKYLGTAIEKINRKESNNR